MRLVEAFLLVVGLGMAGLWGLLLAAGAALPVLWRAGPAPVPSHPDDSGDPPSRSRAISGRARRDLWLARRQGTRPPRPAEAVVAVGEVGTSPGSGWVPSTRSAVEAVVTVNQ